MRTLSSRSARRRMVGLALRVRGGWLVMSGHVLKGTHNRVVRVRRVPASGKASMRRGTRPYIAAMSSLPAHSESGHDKYRREELRQADLDACRWMGSRRQRSTT